jgi:hypothetical protein
MDMHLKQKAFYATNIEYTFTYDSTILQYIFTDYIWTIPSKHFCEIECMKRIQKLTVSGALISLQTQNFFSMQL